MTIYRRYIASKPYNHPPIPETWDRTSSFAQTPRINTGNQPGPGSEGPLDPRLYYPRTINTARKPGEGCSSCKWQGQCKIFYYQRNFGHIYRDNDSGILKLSPKLGTACESWNVVFAPLPPEAYDQDGLGVGDPYSDGRAAEEGAFDPFTYVGQYGDLRWRSLWSVNSVNE